jgi:hypothetical protein
LGKGRLGEDKGRGDETITRYFVQAVIRKIKRLLSLYNLGNQAL